jgi:tellurite resistance protein
MTPAWFIPIAGNFLVPVGGVPLGFVETSWFFFSVALVFWLVLFTIAMHRVVFCAPMTEKSLPTLFILLAPPSIGLSAYFAFTGGEAGPLAHILYCFGLFVAILIASLADRFLGVHYFLSWWAMTFPSSAWAGACISYYKAHPTPMTGLVACLALFVATVLLGLVFVRTLVALGQGVLLRE